MKEIDEDNLGLIVGSDIRGFIDAAQAKSTHKVSRRPQNRRYKEDKLLDFLDSYGIGQLHLELTHQYIRNTNLPTPSEWKMVRQATKAVFYQLALESMALECGGSTYTIDLNLSADHVRVGNKKGSIVDHARRKIRQRLIRGGFVEPQFWLSLEVVTPHKGALTKTGRPHIHGAIMLPPDQELEKVKKHIKINNSDNPVFKNHELRVREIYDGINRARYALKFQALSHTFLPAATLLSKTNGVARHAKDLYSAFRFAIRDAKRNIR